MVVKYGRSEDAHDGRVRQEAAAEEEEQHEQFGAESECCVVVVVVVAGAGAGRPLAVVAAVECCIEYAHGVVVVGGCVQQAFAVVAFVEVVKQSSPALGDSDI